MANEITKNTSLLIDKMQGQFAKVLPKILTPERFCRVVLSAVNKNPALGQALMSLQSQASVISAFMSCAELGLEPDGRRATITCFAKKSGGYDVTLIPMFQGLAELAMRSGLISTIHVEKVCENDVFEWNLGRIVNHIPNWKGERGEPYLYYAHVVFRDGMIKDEVMTREEVNAIRNSSNGYKYAISKNSDNTPWIQHYDEMAKKTVFRRCAKWLPLSPELQHAFEVDNEDFGDSAVNITATAAEDKFAQATAIPVVEEPPALPEETTAQNTSFFENAGTAKSEKLV